MPRSSREPHADRHCGSTPGTGVESLNVATPVPGGHTDSFMTSILLLRRSEAVRPDRIRDQASDEPDCPIRTSTSPPSRRKLWSDPQPTQARHSVSRYGTRASKPSPTCSA